MASAPIFSPRSVGRTLGRLLHYFRPFWLALVGVLLLMIVNAWVQVVTPELFGQAVDCYLTPATVGATTAAIDADMTAQGEQPPAQAPTGEPPANDALSCWFGAVPAGSPTVDFVAGLGRLVLGLVVIYVVGAITGGLMFYLMGWAASMCCARSRSMSLPTCTSSPWATTAATRAAT